MRQLLDLDKEQDVDGWWFTNGRWAAACLLQCLFMISCQFL